MFTGEVHPFAELFPLLSESELQDLADDIAENGQLNPILLTPGGVLLDGRNRLEACHRKGVEPKFETHEGDPYALIASANVERRNLSASQQAAFRALALDAQGKRQGGQWVYGSVTESTKNGGSATYLRDAGTILDADRDLLLLVASEASRADPDDPERLRLVTIPFALKLLKARQAAEAAERRRSEQVKNLAPDLVEQIRAGAKDPGDALAEYARRVGEQERRDAEVLANRTRDLTRLAAAVATIRHWPETTMEGFDLELHLETDRERACLLRPSLLAARESLDRLVDWSEE